MSLLSPGCHSKKKQHKKRSPKEQPNEQTSTGLCPWGTFARPQLKDSLCSRWNVKMSLKMWTCFADLFLGPARSPFSTHLSTERKGWKWRLLGGLGKNGVFLNARETEISQEWGNMKERSGVQPFICLFSPWIILRDYCIWDTRLDIRNKNKKGDLVIAFVELTI